MAILITLTTSLSKLQAQSTNSFLMSSIGSIPGAYNTGLSIQFNSINTCLSVQNGVAVLYGVRNNGQFAINCEVTLNINSLGIKIYPNPANITAKVKFTNTPPLVEIFNLTIWTTDGILISSKKESGYNLFQGINLDVSSLTAGSYVLKVESTNYVDALKFIKVN
ncbi:MAG: T9SS type A sorting domain-containing protein [Sediminibacterium sp.]